MSKRIDSEVPTESAVVRVDLPDGPRADLVRFAESMPGARLDLPWGEIVAKVHNKVFVFFGSSDDSVRLSLKLPQSGIRVLESYDAQATGYGLGKHGWVTVCPGTDSGAALEQVKEWIRESWMAVAPKRLIKAHPEVHPGRDR